MEVEIKLMSRRINNDDYQNIKMATTRLDLPVVSSLANPKSDWRKITRGANRIANSLEVDWKKFNINDYIFNHCSIISSVQMEPNGYYIKPVCNFIVNANGNSWSNEVVLATFKSFIGAQNFLEHNQCESQSKGKILDAVLRPFTYKDNFGNTADVFICDILVATSRNHWDLVQKILSGQMTSLSMGCLANAVQCSKCGKIFNDDEDSCDHIKHELLSTFKDENGITRIVSELCGASRKNPLTGQWEGIPDSNKFIEASWVENPAFKGAVINHMVEANAIDGKTASILGQDNSLEDMISDSYNIRVADRYGKLCLRLAQEARAKRIREKTINNIIWGNK